MEQHRTGIGRSHGTHITTSVLLIRLWNTQLNYRHCHDKTTKMWKECTQCQAIKYDKPHQICPPPIVHLPSQAHAGTIKQYPFHKLVGIWSYEARSPSILKSQKRKARYHDDLHYFFLQNRNKNRIPRRVRGSRDLVNIVTAAKPKTIKMS